MSLSSSSSPPSRTMNERLIVPGVLGDTKKKPVIVRKVWSANMECELSLICSTISIHGFAAVDVEFPGTIFEAPVNKHEYNTLPPEFNYSIMKTNVDLLKPIQFGLALSDPYGNLPDFGTDNAYIWEFNFSDFDPLHDPHKPESVELLRRQGIDFAEYRKFGIQSVEFRRSIFKTGLISMFPKLSWVTFQGSYDFGYMIKILTQKPLPENIEGFMGLVGSFYGVNVFDVKHVMQFCCGLYGGLDKVANVLGVERAVGLSHQAGSDSLLTMRTFLKIADTYFDGHSTGQLVLLGGFIYGLGWILVFMDEAIMVRLIYNN